MTVFLFAITIIVTLLVAYDYLLDKRKMRQIDAELKLTQEVLKKSHETALDLQEKLKTQNAKLESTFADPITNLLGWQIFLDRLNQSIKETERHHLPLCVMLIDVNDFKLINDALENDIGDALLREVASRLQTCLRQVDSISRLHKDVFVVLLTQLSKPESAAVVALRMLHTLDEPIKIEDHELHITACIGMSLCPQDSMDANTLLRNAEQALDNAKEKGKQLYQFYQEKMHTKSQRELDIYSSLSRDTIYNEFVIYYHPVMNINDNTVVCMDALLNWRHPEIGLISEEEIFYYAEKQRKANSVSEWLLQNACRQFTHWQSLGFNPQLLGIPVAVKQLENSNFIYRLSIIMQESGFKPEQLLLELNEDFLKVSFDILEKAFNMLKYMGVSIAINNFGEGSLSLRYLKSLPITYIKLDRSFADDVVENEQGKALVESIINLANKMSLKVIAQGIESPEQVRVLKELGCDLLEGKLFGEPLTDSEVVNKMTVTTE